jgi:hypothetical protein
VCNRFYLYPQYRRFRNQLSTVVEVVGIEFATPTFGNLQEERNIDGRATRRLALVFRRSLPNIQNGHTISCIQRIMLSTGEPPCRRGLGRPGRAKRERHLPEEMA